jgi:polysaccharide export outer membrane protein
MAAVLGMAWAARAEEIFDYKIAPLDVVIVDVVNEKELTKEFRVSAKGEISFPYLGPIKVATRTTSEVQEDIRAQLEKDYLVDPQVIVQVKEHAKRRVNMTGQVHQPGQLIMPDEQKMTILDAIAAAGGTTRLARDSAVQITRLGQEKPLKFDLDELRKNPTLNKQFSLEPGDTIHVPESKF